MVQAHQFYHELIYRCSSTAVGMFLFHCDIIRPIFLFFLSCALGGPVESVVICPCHNIYWHYHNSHRILERILLRISVFIYLVGQNMQISTVHLGPHNFKKIQGKKPFFFQLLRKGFPGSGLFCVLNLGNGMFTRAA